MNVQNVTMVNFQARIQFDTKIPKYQRSNRNGLKSIKKACRGPMGILSGVGMVMFGFPKLISKINQVRKCVKLPS